MTQVQVPWVAQACVAKCAARSKRVRIDWIMVSGKLWENHGLA